MSDEKRRKPGRPKGSKASEKQKATNAQARKASAEKRAARKAEREAAKSKGELVKPRWKQLEDGDITVSDLSDEELVRGEVANADGSWEGRRHPLDPRMLGRMNTEYKRRIRKGMDRLGMIAIDAIEERLEDSEAPAQQFSAAKMVIEYNIGKVPDVVHVGAETEWDRMATTAFTILRGEENVVDPEAGTPVAVTGREDIVDAEWSEETTP